MSQRHPWLGVGTFVKREIRKAMLRDNRFCTYCGVRLTHKTATFDHKIPKSKGGDNSPGNLAMSCFDCNVRKADSVVPAEID